MATQIKMCKLICTRCTTFSTVWNFTNWECYPKKVSFLLSSGDVAIYRLVMQYLGIGNSKKCYQCQPVKLYTIYKILWRASVVILLPLSAGVSFLAFPAAVALATDINWYCFESYSYGELGVPGSEL